MTFSATIIADVSNRQSTLDGAIVVQSRVPPYSKEGLLDHIVQLTTVEDKVSLLLMVISNM
jgi:hypothetical protein